METVSGKFFSGFELINTDVLVSSAYFLRERERERERERRAGLYL
jgi:hypothetical protein